MSATQLAGSGPASWGRKASEIGGARETEDASRAAQSEKWGPNHIFAQPDPLGEMRVQRGGRDPGGADRDHTVDCLRLEADCGQRATGRILQQIERSLEEERIAPTETHRLQISRHGKRDPPTLDAAMVEQLKPPIQLVETAAEEPARAFFRNRLR
mgnify:CR=1 FL=1